MLKLVSADTNVSVALYGKTLVYIVPSSSFIILSVLTS